jgi:ribosomal protein L37AE/L43A
VIRFVAAVAIAVGVWIVRRVVVWGRRCPNCDSSSTRRDRAAGIYTCAACGHSWRFEDVDE